MKHNVLISFNLIDFVQISNIINHDLYLIIMLYFIIL